jgi:hypothetical protein
MRNAINPASTGPSDVETAEEKGGRREKKRRGGAEVEGGKETEWRVES